MQQRRRELGLTQEGVRARGGPSTATMRLIEGGHQESYRPGILADLERALHWTAGSVEAILAGGDPKEFRPDSVSFVRTAPEQRHAAAEAPSDDADIQLVMDADLPEDLKHELVRDLLRERVEQRQQRVERARRLIGMYRRAQGE